MQKGLQYKIVVLQPSASADLSVLLKKIIK